MGDLYDLYSFSRFARSHDVMTPKQEMTDARIGAEEFWTMVKKRLPKSSLYQIIGNHDARPAARMMEKFPEIASLIDLTHYWKFDGVNTISDPKEPLILEDIIFTHGFLSKLGEHMKYFGGRNTVCGHSHRGGVFYLNTGNGIRWELNAGYLADPDSAALSYRPTRFNHWTLGYGIIDEHGPRFCPL